MTISERLVERTKQLRTAKDEIKRLKLDVKQRDDMISGLDMTLKETQSKLDKWIKQQENGYCAVAINNGYVVEAVNVPPYSIFTYTQPIDSDISTALYRTIPFIKLIDGKMEIDTDQKSKYRGVIL
jgi:hypothetical protein